MGAWWLPKGESLEKRKEKRAQRSSVPVSELKARREVLQEGKEQQAQLNHGQYPGFAFPDPPVHHRLRLLALFVFPFPSLAPPAVVFSPSLARPVGVFSPFLLQTLATTHKKREKMLVSN